MSKKLKPLSMILVWDVETSLNELKRQIIIQTIKYFKDNRTHAAEALKINRGTIVNLIGSENGRK